VNLHDGKFAQEWIALGYMEPGPVIEIETENGDGETCSFSLPVTIATALRNWLNGALAQMEERRALNAEASGSTPERAAK
jgi:hypothetical protein